MMYTMKRKVKIDKYLNYKKEFESDPFFEAIPVNKDGRYVPIGKSSDENLKKVAYDIHCRLAP